MSPPPPLRLRAGAVLLLVVLLAAPAAAQGDPPHALYTAALTRERALRSPGQEAPVTLPAIRALIADYDAIARRFPRSGYSDNALWQAAGLALEAFERFGVESDRQAGLRFLRQLETRYPASALLTGLDVRRQALVSAVTREERRAALEPVRIRGIDREILDDVVRVTIALDREVPYHQERLADPDRLFVDFRGALPAPGVRDLAFDEDTVRGIRLGPRPGQTTRVVLDLEGEAACRASAVHAPYRLVIDCERPAPPPVLAADARSVAPVPTQAPRAPVPRPVPIPRPQVFPGQEGPPPAPVPAPVPAPPPVPEPAPAAPALPADELLPADDSLAADDGVPSGPLPDPVPEIPAPPEANSSGGYSLARQLGLGISRIVIDPGHGGRDPGARANRLVEAEVVLDIALRLEQLLLAEPGIEVILTRRTDIYVPLQERTAIANRAGADLLLSIHANASRNVHAHGIETYYLNFASSPEAAEVAARENAPSGQHMGELPDIVRAIALNNKLDESRDLAALVQESMVTTVRPVHREVRNLGVKRAPFVVLIGAEMPSVLAEVAFLTNRQEAQLLATPAYRQRLAEGLRDAVLRYQRSLQGPGVGTVAARER